MEFTEEQWKKLRNLAKKLKILFISSPFSIKAFNLLSDLDIDCWKIASGNFSMMSLLRISQKQINQYYFQQECLLTMIFLKYSRIISSIKNLCLMQCTSEYPCKPENLDLM